MLGGPRILQNKAMTAIACRHTDRKVFTGQRGNTRSIMYMDLPDVARLDLGDLGGSVSCPCFELYTAIAPQNGLIRRNKIYMCFSSSTLPFQPFCCLSCAGPKEALADSSALHSVKGYLTSRKTSRTISQKQTFLTHPE